MNPTMTSLEGGPRPLKVPSDWKSSNPSQEQGGDNAPAPEKQALDIQLYPDQASPDAQAAGLASGIDSLGGARAYTAAAPGRLESVEIMMKNYVMYDSLLKSQLSEIVPSERSDWVEDLRNGILAGKIKADPSLLEYVLSQPPKTLDAPTPRDRINQIRAQIMLTALGGVADAIGGGSSTGAPSAGMSIFGASLETIAQQDQMDEQLKTMTLLKNAEIFNKYRDDVIAAWKDLDAATTAREKNMMNLVIAGMKNDEAEYEKKVDQHNARQSAIQAMATNAGTQYSEGDREYAKLVSNTLNQNAQRKTEVSQTNAKLAFSKYALKAKLFQARQEGKLTASPDAERNILNGANVLAQLGVNPSYLNSMRYRFDQSVLQKVSGSATIYGNQAINAVRDMVKESSGGLFGTSDKSLRALAGEYFNTMLALANNGTYINFAKLPSIDMDSLVLTANPQGAKTVLTINKKDRSAFRFNAGTFMVANALAELDKKQSAGTITPQEVQRRQEILQSGMFSTPLEKQEAEAAQAVFATTIAQAAAALDTQFILKKPSLLGSPLSSILGKEQPIIEPTEKK